ncbi:hypothetical protein BH18ACT10_BH18ACT10_07350 [soil metagenome]
MKEEIRGRWTAAVGTITTSRIYKGGNIMNSYASVLGSASERLDRKKSALLIASLFVMAMFVYSLMVTQDANAQTVPSGPVAWGDNSSNQLNVPSGLTNVKTISAGWKHNLALKNDGTVVAWGDNASGQTNVPLGLTNVQAISAGGSHSLALKADGTIVSWGDNSYGQRNMPAGLTNVKAISAGYTHSLALKNDGTVVAWGYNSNGQTNVPAGVNEVEAISGGGYHSLALNVPTPPGAVNLFDAGQGDGQVYLIWSNPSDVDFTAVRVLRSTTGFATSATPDSNQTQVYEGTAQSFNDTGLANGTTYYYTAYAKDDAGLWSAQSTSQAMPVAVDTTAPAAPVITSPANNTSDNDGSFTLSGTAEPNSTVKIYEGTTLKITTTTDADGAWSASFN